MNRKKRKSVKMKNLLPNFTKKKVKEKENEKNKRR